jgi:hypothetical protein
MGFLCTSPFGDLAVSDDTVCDETFCDGLYQDGMLCM